MTTRVSLSTRQPGAMLFRYGALRIERLDGVIGVIGEVGEVGEVGVHFSAMSMLKFKK